MKQLGYSLLNYLKNLKFVIIPIGIFTLFALLGIGEFFSHVATAIDQLVKDANATISNGNFDLGSYLSVLVNNLSKLDWTNPNEYLSNITSSDFLQSLFSDALRNFLSPEQVSGLSSSIQNCIGTIFLWLALLLVTLIAGIIVGNWVTTIVMHKSMMNTKWSKVIIYALLDGVFMALIALFIIFMNSLWNYAVFIIVPVSIILAEFWHISLSYIIYARKKIKFREVFNTKTTLFSILANFIITIITAGLCLLLWFFVSKLLAIFLIVSLIQVMFVINEFNTSSYVKAIAERKEAPKKKEKSA